MAKSRRSRSDSRKTLHIIIALLIVLSIPLTVFALQREQNFQKKASASFVEEDLNAPDTSDLTITAPMATIVAVADSYVNAGFPTTNYGTETKMLIGGNPQNVAYLKFNLAPLSGKTITKAILKFKVPDITGADSPGNFKIKLTSSSWTQAGINYSNRPALGNLITSFAAPMRGQVIQIDITSWISGVPSGSVFSMGIETGSANPATIKSREAGGGRPALLIDYQ